MPESVRFAAWAAFWGDTPRALTQVLRAPDIDYLVSDYLAEITMALLARARAKDPSVGYVRDALTVLEPALPEISARGIKVISNAGALHPRGCAQALQSAVDEAGLGLLVASVEGDDLVPRLSEALDAGARDMFTGERIPDAVSSLNAYLGARPIARALDAGADIVITGRCVDAAVVLGPLIHEFGWVDDDYDLLAAGTLAGHIIECGPQCTGGIHTDWAAVPGWDDIGYPIADVAPDGAVVIGKPPGTGGLVSVGTVSEQIVYEIGDPGAYVMPDVVCDWRGVRVEPAGPDEVRVSGARGSAPTTSYKATATVQDGYRALTTAMFAGIDAGARARRAGEALVARTERLLAADGLGPLSEASVEVVGGGQMTGAATGDHAALDAVMKVGVRHPEKAALDLFAQEFAPFGLIAQGMTGVFAGRPRVAPVFRVLHLLVDKAAVHVVVRLGEQVIAVAPATGSGGPPPASPELTWPAEPAALGEDTIEVSLRQLAWGRSGDKGDQANIGLVARNAEFLPVIRAQVTADRVARFFARYEPGEVHCWELPGLVAVNFLIDGVLGGSGGTSTLRYDPQGKSYAAMLLTLRLRVPRAWEARLGCAEGAAVMR